MVLVLQSFFQRRNEAGSIQSVDDDDNTTDNWVFLLFIQV